MRVYVTGGTGFLGAALLRHLAGRGHDLVLLTRETAAAREAPPQTTLMVGDPLSPGPWWDEVANCDAAVNLAGAPILCRWRPDYKALIENSRVLTTRNLVAAIPQGKRFSLFSASGVGIYGDSGETPLEEDAPVGSDFLAQVAARWEAEALAARAKEARVVIGRLAMVLGRNGGALHELLKNAKSFSVGPMAGGSQWVSWIHIDDAVDAITLLLESPQAEGVYNLAAPQAVRQGDLAQAVNKRLGIRATLPISRFFLRMTLGEVADHMLSSQKMVPRRLGELGFKHRYPDLDDTLRSLLP